MVEGVGKLRPGAPVKPVAAPTKTAVEPAVSKSPTRSGIVTLIRYQLKQRRPVERRSFSVAGPMASQAESSKSAAPACGAMS